jgi:SAM-dependent methyltransferase
LTALPPQLALAYDETFSDRVSRAEDLAVRRLIARYVDDADVLDVGCGTGLALTMGRPRSYLGIDASPVMIQRARERWSGVTLRDRPMTDERIPLALHPSPVFAVCPAETFRTEAPAFDTVTCLWALPYLDAPALVVESWWDQLRPGGAAVIVSWDGRYTPTWPVPFLPAPMSLIARHAQAVGFRPRPLGGLMRRETARKLARALPIPLAAWLIQSGAQSPAFVLALEKPGLAPVRRPPTARRVTPLVKRPVPFGPGRTFGGP